MSYLEARVVAGIEGQALVRHMEDAVRHGIEQGAVMAHHHERPGIAPEMGFQPCGRLEVEMVGRLVEQQQVGLDEEPGGERDPHAPTAGEAGERRLLHRLVDAEAGEQPRRARRRRMRADLREPGLDLGAARPPGALCIGDQGRALPIGGEHGFARRLRAARDLLIDQPDGPAAGAQDRALIGLEPARDEAKQGGLAAAIASDQPKPAVGADLRGHAFEKKTPLNPVSDVLEGQHG